MTTEATNKVVLDVSGLSVSYRVRSRSGSGRGSRVLQAVNDVSLNLRAGEVLGIVGESGCGKSTLARAIMGLVEPDSGDIVVSGENTLAMSRRKSRMYRRHYQMIFQDPLDSINPRMTCSEIIAEPMEVFFPTWSRTTILRRVAELMAEVGLDASMMRRFPHEFSGGQRQRISIARAIGVEPDILVCDEAVSALDVSVQAQILNLLNRIKCDRSLAMLFISHDLSVVRHLSDRVIVMYLGKVVEEGQVEHVIDSPQHPYTKSLIAAVPQYGQKFSDKILAGDIPSPINLPKGCLFAGRCPQVKAVCTQKQPQLSGKANHRAACHLLIGESSPRTD